MVNKRGTGRTAKVVSTRNLRSNLSGVPISDEGDMSDPGNISSANQSALHRTNSLGQIYQPLQRSPPSGPMAHFSRDLSGLQQNFQSAGSSSATQPNHQEVAPNSLFSAAPISKASAAPVNIAPAAPVSLAHTTPGIPQPSVIEQVPISSPRRSQGRPAHVTTTDFAALLTIVQDQATQIQHQFNFIVNNQNEQLAQQQDVMNTMRQEFMQNQRLIATELAQTRETLAINNQFNRRNQNVQQFAHNHQELINPQRMQANVGVQLPRGPVLQQNFQGIPRQNLPVIQEPQIHQNNVAPAIAPVVLPLVQQQNVRPPQVDLIQQPIRPDIPLGIQPLQLNAPGHNPTFHLKAIELPHYSGAHENKTPYDFLIELDKYKAVSRSTDQFMTNEVAPLALQGQAFHWYRFEMSISPFESFEDFKVRFRKEFQTLGYNTELTRELELRSQGPTEPLTQFIRIIVDFYKRLGQNPPEEEIVNRIKRQMHPEFMQALQGKVLNTVRDMMDAAFEAQDLIKAFRTYRPPPLVPGVEPSLRWNPVDMTPAITRYNVNTFIPISDKPDARLHPLGIDPYTYYHAQAERIPNRQVSFNDQAAGQSSRQNWEDNRPSYTDNNRPRPYSPAPPQNQQPSNRPPQQQQQQQSNTRPPSPGVQRPSTPVRERRCYDCNSLDHIRPCPLKSPTSNQRSGNSPAPSPTKNGLGRNA
jgi:hypothetical protein